MTGPGDVRQLAAQLRHAYNPLTPVESWSATATNSYTRDKWIAVATTALTSSICERERLAAKLHATFVRDLLDQKAYGWPPRSDGERDRWLAVADAFLAQVETAP